MPTGYTAGVYDGTIKTGKDFLKTCLRAFGVFVEYRDDAPSPILPTKKFEIDPFYLNYVNESVKKYNEKLSWSDEDWKKAYKEACDKARIDCKEAEVRSDKNYMIYNKIYREILDIDLPEEYKELKDFALSQLKGGEGYDFSSDFGSTSFELKSLHELEQEGVEGFKKNTLKTLLSTLEYSVQSYQEQLDRLEDKQAYLDGFLKAIGE